MQVEQEQSPPSKFVAQFASLPQTTQAPEHAGVFCDECKHMPRQTLRGLRYKCGHCANYDLCESCMRYTTHPQDHVFLLLRDGSRDSHQLQGVLLAQALPLLLNDMRTRCFSPVIRPPQQQSTPQQSTSQQPAFDFGLSKQQREQQRRFAPLNDAYHRDSEAQSDHGARPVPFSFAPFGRPSFGDPFPVPRTPTGDAPPETPIGFGNQPFVLPRTPDGNEPPKATFSF